jgi:hypothetical protein
LLGFGSVSRAQQGTIFLDSFDDGAAASRWSVVSQQESTGTAPPDGTVNFAFDYGSLGIPSPTGGATTTGVYIQVNNTDQAGNEGESYSIFPNAVDLPPGNWRIDADMYVYNDGNPGTTEFGMIGSYLNRSAPVSPYQFGTVGGPLAWKYSGEGGAASDLAAFKGGSPTATGYTPLNDYNNVPADTIPGFQTGSPGSLGPAGTNPRGNWVDVTLEKVGDTIGWYLNGVLVDSFDNSGGTYTTGTFLLGASDPFNSSSLGTGTIIDNVVVTPEPAAPALLALASLLALRRRRATPRTRSRRCGSSGT